MIRVPHCFVNINAHRFVRMADGHHCASPHHSSAVTGFGYKALQIT